MCPLAPKIRRSPNWAFCVSERSAPDETFLTNLTVPHLTSWFYQVRTRCSWFCLDMILDFDPFWKHPLLFDVKSCGRRRYPVSSLGLPGCYSLASRAVHSPLRKCFSAQNGDTNLHVSVKLSHSLRRFKHPHKAFIGVSLELAVECKVITAVSSLLWLFLSVIWYKVLNGKPAFSLENSSGVNLVQQDNTSCLDCFALRFLLSIYSQLSQVFKSFKYCIVGVGEILLASTGISVWCSHRPKQTSKCIKMFIYICTHLHLEGKIQLMPLIMYVIMYVCIFILNYKGNIWQQGLVTAYFIPSTCENTNLYIAYA